ncbi:YciI family protein [Dactylosporangium sp. NPDC048998]|uniref:YciI family protein n=1 Tax=Dactylosporangium sp. NPDC048998 TaxID=3363976 RepID=UPI003719FD86
MKQYLLSVVEPSTGEPPAAEEMERIMARVAELERAVKEAGVWVFNGGLHQPGTATTLRPKGDDVLITDGPYAEGKEHLGGFLILRCEDLDEALEWARRAVAATTLPIEVRPFR